MDRSQAAPASQARVVPAALMAARAPRYTSYPPATAFGAGVDGATFGRWLSEHPAGEPVSIYLHVPFCRRLCFFCACRTQGTRSDAPLRAYARRLEREVDAVLSRLPEGTPMSRLHFGGGTPTLLHPGDLVALAARVERWCPPLPDAEISIETDPLVAEPERLDALAAIGVTRASVGVQDFEPAVQEAIGRPQTEAATRAAVAGLRGRGIDKLNLDLLYGLPHQTVETLERTLDAALALGPDRLALYGYAHVPWAAKRQAVIREDTLPDGEARIAMLQLAGARLEAAGMEAIGIDHFARPGDGLARAAAEGRLRRNFQGYTDDAARAIVGLGASAISTFPQGYAQNAATTLLWSQAIDEGRPSVARGVALSPEDRLRGAMIEELLCTLSIDPARIEARGAGTRAAAMAALDGMGRDSAILGRRTGDGGFALGRGFEARLVARLAAMGLDTHVQDRRAFSQAI
jgi:oxygen-independent coproporphyrinogen-3 oxidase